MQPETKFKNRIRPILEKLPQTIVFKIQQRTIRGTPDLLICIRGLFVALELKRSKTARLDPLQAFILQKIADADGIAIVVYPENWEAVLGFLKSLSEVKDPYALSNQVRRLTGQKFHASTRQAGESPDQKPEVDVQHDAHPEIYNGRRKSRPKAV